MSKEGMELARKIALEVWEKYDDTYGYRTEKQEAIKAVPSNHPDNIWSFWGPFDHSNHLEFLERVMTAVDRTETGAKELYSWVIEQLGHEFEAIQDLRGKL